MTDSRVEKAYLRMLAAKSLQWQRAWGDGYKSSTSMRNACQSVEVVRLKKAALGTGSGLSAGLGSLSVPDLVPEYTKPFVLGQ
jgi:hypothetical protein